jgi:Flp pilus assembly protein CpaB
VLGGALVALAMVGTFAVADGGGAGHPTQRVVASRALAPGTVLAPDDLATAQVDLPPGTDEGSHGSVDELVGAVLLGPLGPGDLVQRTNVRSGHGDGSSAPHAELTVAVEPARALGGRVRPGEVVDLVVTYGAGADAHTVVATRDATVLDVQTDIDALGPAGTVALSLRLDPDEVLAVAHAAEVGQLRLVRSAGATRDPREGYRTPAGADDPAGAAS